MAQGVKKCLGESWCRRTFQKAGVGSRPPLRGRALHHAYAWLSMVKWSWGYAKLNESNHVIFRFVGSLKLFQRSRTKCWLYQLSGVFGRLPDDHQLLVRTRGHLFWLDRCLWTSKRMTTDHWFLLFQYCTVKWVRDKPCHGNPAVVVCFTTHSFWFTTPWSFLSSSATVKAQFTV